MVLPAGENYFSILQPFLLAIRKLSIKSVSLPLPSGLVTDLPSNPLSTIVSLFTSTLIQSISSGVDPPPPRAAFLLAYRKLSIKSVSLPLSSCIVTDLPRNPLSNLCLLVY